MSIREAGPHQVQRQDDAEYPDHEDAEPIAIVHLPRRGATRVDIAEATAEPGSRGSSSGRR